MRVNTMNFGGLRRIGGRTQAALLGTVAGLALISCASSYGATAGYWRHEEGLAGSLIPDGPDTVLDDSGNGNHMETAGSAFSPFSSATYSSNVPPLPLRSGLSNTLSLDFGFGSDGTTPEGPEPNDDNFTANDKPIETQLFTAMTVELAFNMKSVGPGQFQALFGKDGKPLGDQQGEPNRAEQVLAVKVRGDGFPDMVPNQLQVEWIDGDGALVTDLHFLATRETIVPGTWYHVAFTLTATDAQLWVAQDSGPYLLKDSKVGQDYAGSDGRVLVDDPTPMSIGRGMFNNLAADWSNAFIDEVRVSDVALTPEEFLFVGGAAENDADFDDDGDVDATDFNTWAGTFGGAATGTNGDADGDGDSDGGDFLAWQQQFAPPTPTSGAVPEPGGAALALLAAGGAWRRRQCAAEANS